VKKISFKEVTRVPRANGVVLTCRWFLMLTSPLWLLRVASAEPESPRSMAAVRITKGENIDLDGRLEESVWQRAIPATGFLQQEPVEGEPATEETAVFVLYDSDHLYIGAILYDSNIDGILAYQKQRDAPLYTDDRFAWILDTFLDSRTGYFFEINPAGLMGDGLLESGSRFGVNKSWDGIWEAQVARSDDGWSAEIRIPFRTLNFDADQEIWGINFQRAIRRKNEETLWNGHRRNQGLTRPVHAGRLTGLRGISQGLGLEAKPYAISGWRNIPEEEDPTGFPREVGIDFSYSVTPSLRAALTLNTDFAEVEVDQRRVNLTRFPLYFPEQRDFFLEGSGVFSFAPERSSDFMRQPTNGVTPYFSRRIGLVEVEEEEEEEPVSITYGARLGGQAGRYELGFLQVRTGRHKTMRAEDFTIARVKRSLFRQSYLGVIYTRRASEAMGDTAGPPDRQTFGADLDLFTSRFRGNKNLELQAFFVWQTDPVADSTFSFRNLSAHGARLNYPNDIWRCSLSYRELGNDFDPAIGFTRRNGFRLIKPEITFAPRPQTIASIRQFRFGLEFEYLTDLFNKLETRKTDLTLLGIRFESGDNVTVSMTELFERLDEEFEVHPDIFVPAEDYTSYTWSLRGWTAGYRVLSSRLQFSQGGFWSGNYMQYEASLTVKPYSGISLEIEFEKNDVTLQEGDFSTHLFRLTGGWHMSPWISLTGNLQYDDVSELIGLFTKLRWIIQPGSELYLVYTHNWENKGDRLLERDLSTLSQGATTKVNYTHRF